MKPIKFLDLKAQYPFIKAEIMDGINDVFNSGTFTNGPWVKKFETAFAEYNDAPYCIAVNSGTAALHMALLAVGVGPGDEVIIPANTFIATAEAVSLCGATPVLVDVDPINFNINPVGIKNAITPKTKAIVPVHLYGQMADMGQIMIIAEQHNLKVVEDACQAHGATQNGKKAGTIGDIGCFSFYPGKNLGSYGEGGACITNNDHYNKMLCMLRDHGSSEKYHHNRAGFNYRMSEFQGVVLNTKLRFLDKWNKLRRKHADTYNKHLIGVRTPTVDIHNEHVYHLYVIQTDNRDALIKKLTDADIGYGIHYPIPIHQQDAYLHLGYKGTGFPITEKLSERILSLPMYPELTEQDIIRVCEVLK